MKTLIIAICKDEITILLQSGIEVVHWVEDEWLDDPSITPAIANAIHLAHTEPNKLITMNLDHIRSQQQPSKP
jgi:hypothetical protein